MFKFLKKYISDYKFLFWTGVLCVAFEGICDLLQPTFMARIVDDGIKEGNLKLVLIYGGIMLAISLVGMVFAFSRNIIAIKVSRTIGKNIRRDSYKHVLFFCENSMDRFGSGGVITRLTNDTNQLMSFIGGLMRVFFKAPLLCIGAVIFTFILNYILGLIVLCVIFLVGIIIYLSINLTYKRFNEVQIATDKMNTTTQEYLSGVRVVKAFGKQEQEQEKFEKVNDNLSLKTEKNQLISAYFSPLMTFSVNIGIILIFYIGSFLFNTDNIELGKIAATTSYMTQILSSLVMLTNIFSKFVRVKASSKRLIDLLGSDCEKMEGANIDYNTTKKALLEFRRVTFAYPSGSGKPAISDVSFSLNKGETLAIIGATGSGKSTLTWLILRFYDINNGEIFLNGINIMDLDLSQLRNYIAIVPQKSILFSGEIMENIRLGGKNCTDDQVIKAAELACAHDFIMKFSEGYKTFLGQGGVNISGGQKQRISLARAIAKNAPILILDDCTSALDAKTEAKVRKGIAKLKSTNIIITQRIGTAMAYPKILVMDAGKIVGFGNHLELINNCEVYQEIYNSQIGNKDLEVRL